jgi:hypothetical protein
MIDKLKALAYACGGYQQGDNGMVVNRTPFRELTALVDSLLSTSVLVERALLENVLTAMGHARTCREGSDTDWTNCEGGREALAALAALDGVLR